MLRLRQICLVAKNLNPIVTELNEVLGLQECYRDPVVAKYGLENVLTPIGRNFLEIVAPIEPSTAAARYLERRHGDGGYIVILQCDDTSRRRDLYSKLGIRIANAMDYGNFIGTQLHPKDTGGCMLEVDWQDGDIIDGPWHPAGPTWEEAISTAPVIAMKGAILQTSNPCGLAQQWGQTLDREIVQTAKGFGIELDNALLEFVPPIDDRGDGLVGINIEVSDIDYILKAASKVGLPITKDSVTICGTHFYLSKNNGCTS
jgi:hypothetical protein